MSQQRHLPLALGSLTLLAWMLAPVGMLPSPQDALAQVVPTLLGSQPAADTPVGPETGALVGTPELTSLGALQVLVSLDHAVQPAGQSVNPYLVVQLKASETVAANAPVDLTLVVDTSGSMSGEGSLNARRAASALLEQLGPADRLALIGFSDQARVLRYMASPELRTFQGILNGLTASGSTNIGAGLALARGEQARASEFAAGGTVRRTVLLSDGEATVGLQTPDALADEAAQAAAAGSTVSALGVGVKFDPETLIAISDAGGGRYQYVADPRETATMFAEELGIMRRVSAREVRVRFEAAGDTRVLRSIGYERWDGSSDDTSSSAWIGDMGPGQDRKVVTALYLPPAAEGGQHLGDVIVTQQGLDGVQQELRLPVLLSRDGSVSVASSPLSPALQLVGDALTGDALNQAREQQHRGDYAAARQALQQGERSLDALQLDHSPGASALRQADTALDAARTVEEQRSLELHWSLSSLGYLE